MYRGLLTYVPVGFSASSWTELEDDVLPWSLESKSNYRSISPGEPVMFTGVSRLVRDLRFEFIVASGGPMWVSQAVARMIRDPHANET